MVLVIENVFLREKESKREKILMMQEYGDNISSYETVAALFKNTFPNRLSITKSTVQQTVTRFEETGSFKDRPQTGRLQVMVIRTSKYNNLWKILIRQFTK